MLTIAEESMNPDSELAQDIYNHPILSEIAMAKQQQPSAANILQQITN